MIYITKLFEEFKFNRQFRNENDLNPQEQDQKRKGFSSATKLIGGLAGAHIGSKIARGIHSSFAGDDIDKDNYAYSNLAGIVLGGLAGRSAGKASGTYVYDKFYKKNKKD